MAVDVSNPGTGISFTPPTRFVHHSGESVQALGSGITLESTLDRDHEVGAPIVNTQVASEGYQDDMNPDQWYGFPLSTHAGSITMLNDDGSVIIDAIDLWFPARQFERSWNDH